MSECTKPGPNCLKGRMGRASYSTGTGLRNEYDILVPINEWGAADQRWYVDGDHRADLAHNNLWMTNLVDYVGYPH